MHSEILQKFGFTRAESIIYTLLLKYGSVKAGELIKKSGFQSSTVYNALNGLIEKGHINYVLQGKIKFYQAVDPKFILQEYKEKQHVLEKIMPELEALKKYFESEQTAEIFRGRKGLMAMMNELIKDTNPNDTYYFYAISHLNDDVQNFFSMYDAKRKDKRLIVKGLARKGQEHTFASRRFVRVRYVDFPIPSNIALCNEKMALFNWDDKPVGILINSKQIVETQKKYFEELWNSIR